MAKNNIIPIFIPFAGCPYKCIYCNQIKITGKSQMPTTKDISDSIDEYIKYFLVDQEIELAFYGGTFTMLDFNLQKSYISHVKEYIDKGLISSIRISTRPDAIDREQILLLKEMGLETIEFGIQSIDEDVLRESGRNISLTGVDKTIEFLKESGFKIGLQQMIGLPSDSLEKSIKTAHWIVDQKPDFVRIYPTIVLKNTKMESMYIDKVYEPLSFEEAVSWTSEVLDIYHKNGIEVIRVGLPPLDDLDDFIAGPYNPQFREYAESQSFNNKLITFIKERGIDGPLTILGDQATINRIVGPKKIGLDYLYREIKDITFKNLPKGSNLELQFGKNTVRLNTSKIPWSEVCI